MEPKDSEEVEVDGFWFELVFEFTELVEGLWREDRDAGLVDTTVER